MRKYEFKILFCQPCIVIMGKYPTDPEAILPRHLKEFDEVDAVPQLSNHGNALDIVVDIWHTESQYLSRNQKGTLLT